MSSTVSKITGLFLSWRISLFLVAFIAPVLIPKFQYSFPYAEIFLQSSGLPSWVTGFGNFDGVHYLRIARTGYSAQYSQVFMPLFPRLIGTITPEGWSIRKHQDIDSPMFDYTLYSANYLIVGLIVSNCAFLIGLFLLYKLFRIDFPEKISFKALILLLGFPTAFYFGALYTESLFFALTVACLYSLRRNNFLLAGVFAALASSTRIVGVLLLSVLAIELCIKYFGNVGKIKLGEKILDITGMLISPVGIIGYIIYLWSKFGNPFIFISSQNYFGTGRSSEFVILLPQIIVRYIKIFLAVPITTYIFATAVIEFIATIILFLTLILCFKKMRFSYWFFSFMACLVPTLSGTFSSMPRYALAAFLVLPCLVISIKNKFYIFVTISFILQALLAILFLRGYWIS